MVALLDANAPNYLQQFALDLGRAYVSQFPKGPVRLWGVDQAELPDATRFNGCLVYVRDLGKVGLSNGTAWVQTDGGAL